MGSQSRLLQLKVLDCKDLKAFNFFQKLSVYALVSLVSDHPNKKKLERQQQQRTPTDTQGDRNPEWNHGMRFELGGPRTTSDGGDDDDDHLFLHFDLRSELAIFGDKSVGEVWVLLKDLITNNNRGEEKEDVGYQFSSDSGIVHFVSYQVRTSDGKPNGVLSFAYKVLMKENDGSGGATVTSVGNATATINSLEGNTSSNFPNNSNNYNNVHIDGYPIISGSSSSFPSNSQVHYPSLLAEDYLQKPSGSGQSYCSAAVAPHQPHYPTFETPDSAPPGDGYINYCYPQQPPPPPPPPHDRFHYPPSAAQLPPMIPPPFPPPPPHVGQGSVYHQPQSPWVYNGTRYEW